jgi:hypothetical protein
MEEINKLKYVFVSEENGFQYVQFVSWYPSTAYTSAKLESWITQLQNKTQKQTKFGAIFENSVLQYQAKHEKNLWRKEEKQL